MLMILCFMFYFSAFILFFKKNHLLMFLMVLEFLSLTMVMYLIFFFCLMMYDFSIIIYFIITMVCEAVMGLVLLTLFVRNHGSDYLQNNFIFMC